MTSTTRPGPVRIIAALIASMAMLITGAVVAAPAHAADGHSVSGTVTIPAGVEATEVEVSLYRAHLDDYGDGPYISWAEYAGSAYLDAGNSFEFADAIEPGESYTLRISGGGAATEWLGGVSNSDYAEWFSGETSTTVDLAARLGGVLSGNVTEPDGTPVAYGSAAAYLWLEDTETWSYEVASTEVEDGAFSIEGLLPGTYQLRFFGMAGAYSQYLGGEREAPSSGEGVSVAAGPNPVLEVELAAGPVISGTVTAPDGVDPGTLTAQLYEVGIVDSGEGEYVSWGFPVEWVAVDASGTYTLRQAVPGVTYTVAAYGPGLARTFLGDTPAVESAQWFVTEEDLAGKDINLSAGADVTLTVLDSTEVARDDVWVTAYWWDTIAGEWREVSSEPVFSSGELALEGLPEGDYTFFLSPSGPGAYGQYPDGSVRRPSGPSGPAVRTLVEGDNAPLTFVLAADLSVSGVVSVPDGYDVELVELALWREVTADDGDDTYWTPEEFVRASEDGSYTLRRVVPGEPYVVRASAPGLISQFSGGAATMSSENAFTATEDRTGEDFTMQEAGRLSGVVAEPGGAPAEGVSVEAYTWDDSGYWEYVDSAGSDADGRFAFEGLRPGSYVFHFDTALSTADVHSQYLGGGTSQPDGPGDANVVEIVPGANPDLLVELERGLSVSGQVTGGAGIDLAEVTVRLYEVELYDDGDDGQGVDDYWQVSSTGVAPDGSYSLSGMQAGRHYTLEVSGGGALRQVYGGGRGVYDAEWFTPTADVTGFDFSLEPESTLTGVVSGPEGQPLGDLRVRAHVWDSDAGSWVQSESTWTESDGTFEIGNLPQVPVTLWVDTRDTGSSAYSQFWGGAQTAPEGPEGPFVVDLATGANGPVQVDLAAGLSVWGTVTAGPGVVLEDLEATLLEVWLDEDEEIIDDWETISSVTVGTDGSFTLDGLAPGRAYTVRLGGDGIVTQYFGNVLRAWDADWFTAEDAPHVTFDVVRATEVRGTVVDADDVPVEYVDVNFYRWSGDEWDSVDAYAYTDEEGRFSAALPDGGGIYTLRVDTSWSDTDAFTQFLGGSTSLPDAPSSPLDTARMFEVAEGETAEVAVALSAGVSMTGTVAVPSGVDVEDLEVRVTRLEEQDGELWCADESGVSVDELGIYRARGLVPGDLYTVFFGGSGVIAEYLGGASSCEAATTFVATTDGEIPHHTYQSGATLTGQVVDAVSGDPLAVESDVYLYRWDAEDGWQYEGWRGVEEGEEFGYQNLRPGTYTAQVYPYGHQYYEQYLGGQTAFPEPDESSATFEITAGATLARDFGLQRSRTVSGQVIDAADPTQVTVELIGLELYEGQIDWWWPTGSAVSPDSEGNFELQGMAPGAAYTVRISGGGAAQMYYSEDGGVLDPMAADWWFGDVNVTGKNFHVQVGYSIQGNFDLDGGSPPSGADVQLSRWNESNETWDYLTAVYVEDFDAGYQFDSLTPGRYAIWISAWGSDHPEQWAGGFADAPDPAHASVIELVAGTTTVTSDITLRRGGTVTGVFQSATADDVFVELWDGDTSMARGWTTPGEQFELVALPGTFELRVRAWDWDVDEEDEYLAATVAGVKVSPGGTTDVGTLVDVRDGSPSVSIGAVTVTGSASVGESLSVTATGVSPSDATLTYQWLRDGDEVEGATSSSYTVGPEDVHGTLSVRVTASAEGLNEATVTSEETAAVPRLTVGVSLAASGPEQVLGGPPVTLTATVSMPEGVTVPGMLDFRRDGAGVGAMDLVDGVAQYELQSDLAVGEHVFTAVFLSDFAWAQGGTSAPVTVTVLAPPELPDLDTPVITGTVALGETLTASVSTELPEGTGLVYQWFRNGVAAPGGDSAEYQVTVDDIGTQLSVRVTAWLALAEEKSATSAPTVAVPKAPSSVVLTASGTQQVFGGAPVKLTASITTVPFTSSAGTVTFTWADGEQSVAVADDKAVLSVPSTLAVGTHSFTASFEPTDVRVAGGVSAPVTLTVLGAAPVLPELDVPVISGTATVGETLTASVATELPGGTELAFQWLRDGEAVGGATSAQYVVAVADVGSQLSVRVTASLEEAQPRTVTSSATAVVPPVASSIALAASAAQQTVGGTPVTLTATVGVPAGAAAGGSVTFSRGGAEVSTQAVVAGKASFTLPADLAVGAHEFTASFAPADVRVAGSSSAPVTVTVLAAPVDPDPPVTPQPPVQATVTLSSSRAKQAYGIKTPAVLTASVAAAGGSTAGKVVFKDGSKTLGTVNVSGGKASLTVKKTLAVGKHRLTAQFVPAGSAVLGATSKAVTLTVSKAKAKVTAKLAATSVKAKARARVTVTVKATGVPKPTGKLVIYRGKKKIATVTLKAKHKGKLTIKLPKLAKGKHKIKVTYQGSKTVGKKTSKVVTLRVR